MRLRQLIGLSQTETPKSSHSKGVYQSGQMGQTVNLLTLYLRWFESIFAHNHFNSYAEVAQLIEHQPSKLRVASLSLVFRSNFYANVAQGRALPW